MSFNVIFSNHKQQQLCGLFSADRIDLLVRVMLEDAFYQQLVESCPDWPPMYSLVVIGITQVR